MTRVRFWSHQTFRSFASRNFRLFFAGLSISMTGTWIQQVAQVWLVLDLGGNGVELGITTALQFAPVLLFGAWAGVLADRFDKRRVLFVTQTAALVCALALGLLALAGGATLAWVWAIAFALGCVTAADNPARRAFVTDLVPADDVPNAVGLNSAVMTASRIVGPAVAGLLISQGGVAWCFLLNAASFIAVLAALAAMRPSEFRPAPVVPREKGQVRAGLRYVWSTPSLRLPLMLTAVIGTIAFNYPVVLPLLAKDTFSGDAGTYTLLFSLMSVGSLIGALAAASRSRRGPRFMVAAAAAFGVTTMIASAAPTLPLAVAALVPVGLTGIAFMSSATAELQLNSDPTMRGRVLALHAVVFLGSTPLGGPLVGWITEAYGPRIGLAVGGVAAVAAVAVAIRARRAHPLADLADSWHARRDVHRLAA